MTEELQTMKPDAIVESPLHHRQHWGDMDALAASIAERGMLEPLLGRRVNGSIELVFGHRRLRAAQKVGAAVPIRIVALTDAEVVHAQLDKNLHRQDLHPMDEAELLGRAMKFAGTLEGAAALRGCDPAIVRRRLQLLKLSKKVRKLFLDGALSEPAAFAIARIPSDAQQERAVKVILETTERQTERRDLQTFETVAEIVRDEFMLALADAPFDCADAALVPKAGSCQDCPKRTGVQRELFAEVAQKDDLCTDPGCYRQKCAARWDQIKVEARAAGDAVLSKKEADAAFHRWSHDRPRPLDYGSSYVDAAAPVGYLDSGKKLQKTWEKAVGDHAPARVYALDPDGVPRALYDKKAAHAALVKAGVVTAGKAGERRSATPSEKRAKHEARVQREAAREIVRLCGERVRDDLKAGDDLTVRALARALVQRHAALTDVAKLLGTKETPQTVESLRDDLVTAGPARRRQVLVQVAMIDVMQRYGFGGHGEAFIEMAAAIGIDVKDVTEDVRERLKAKAGEKRPAKGPKKKGGKKPAK